VKHMVRITKWLRLPYGLVFKIYTIYFSRSTM